MATITTKDGVEIFSEDGRPEVDIPPEWTEPFPPFHIAGNLHFVGSKDLW